MKPSPRRAKQLSNGCEEYIRKLKTLIRTVFNEYDLDGNGTLDPHELRNFINEIRLSMNLYKCDDYIFNRITDILDENEDGVIEQKELIERMCDIQPILAESGEDITRMIKKAYNDFDVSQGGKIQRPEFKLMIDLMADRMKVERCPSWKIDYIFSLFDTKYDGDIRIDSFLANHGHIHRELVKNRTLKRKHLFDFFGEGMHVKLDILSRERDKFQEELAVNIKQFVKDVTFINRLKFLDKPDQVNQANALGALTSNNTMFAKQLIPLSQLFTKDTFFESEQEICILFFSNSFSLG